ncbi:hypothetical protein [Spartinivicinus poritis]|uniref:Uncharacterized protein n=1 Tax=Spartinivicinus poritis TaxID=2994640 RepID=A0ABT5U9X4_9GAMM|nr:hypothetical protein [Spartinivicinus sp. A2-2]MDE1463097.1 hypothetical protein [Spartinivicinus sp. A2-2]
MSKLLVQGKAPATTSPRSKSSSVSTLQTQFIDNRQSTILQRELIKTIQCSSSKHPIGNTVIQRRKLDDEILKEDIQATRKKVGTGSLTIFEVLKYIADAFRVIYDDSDNEPSLLIKLKTDSVMDQEDYLRLKTIYPEVATIDKTTRHSDIMESINALTNRGERDYPSAGELRLHLVKSLGASFLSEDNAPYTTVGKSQQDIINELKAANVLNDLDMEIFDKDMVNVLSKENKKVLLHQNELGTLASYGAAMVQIVFGGSTGRSSPDYSDVFHLHVGGNAQDNLIFKNHGGTYLFLGVIPFHMERGLSSSKKERIKKVHDRGSDSSSSFSKYKLFKRSRNLELDG